VRRTARWAPWILLAALAAAALAIGIHRSSKPSLDAEVTHIASEVRCPVCNGESVAESQAAPSLQIRNEIRSELLQGESSSQILTGLVRAYGSGILEKPQASGVGLIVWVLPVVAVVIAAAALAFVLARWKRRGSEAEQGGEGMAAVEDDGALFAEPFSGATGAALSHPGQLDPTVADPVATDPAPVPAAVAPAATGPQVGKRRLVVGAAGTLIIAGVVSWAVARSSSTRLAGEPVTGASSGPQVVLADLQQARAYASKGDLVNAVKSYQKVLSADPTQVDALTEEGWLLVETGQPALLQEGLTDLEAAEQASPTFADAHLYRGLGLLGERDYSDAVPELEWYLSHSPDRQIAPRVRVALAQAQSGAAAASKASTSTTEARP
jgi:cytochrome c-type biogenesis protein CcmH